VGVAVGDGVGVEVRVGVGVLVGVRVAVGDGVSMLVGVGDGVGVEVGGVAIVGVGVCEGSTVGAIVAACVGLTAGDTVAVAVEVGALIPRPVTPGIPLWNEEKSRVKAKTTIAPKIHHIAFPNTSAAAFSMMRHTRE
jgi:hypothetical protein